MIDITNYFTTNMHAGQFQIFFLAVAFLGGILASVSPCSLSMLPVIIGYVGGYGDRDNKVIFAQLVSFILGSAAVFSLIGIICAFTGKVFGSFGGDYFILIIASLLLVLGLNLIGVLDINFPTLINKVPQNKNNSKYIYPFLLGAVFAIAGTPCSTPILAGIMSFAVITKSFLLSVIMLFLFAVGQGLILLIAGMFTGVIKKFGDVALISELMIKISGVLLILVSFYMFFRVFIQFV